MPLSRSAKYYRDNPTARAKKQRYDARLNSRPSQVNKREDANRERARAKRRGVKVSGRDWDHGSGRMIKSSVNRGKTSGTPGDRNARGGKVKFGRRKS